MSMQKGKPTGSKTGYLQGPLLGYRPEDTSTSGGWGYVNGRSGGKLKVCCDSGWIFWLLQHPHTARQKLTLCWSPEVHSVEKLKIRNPRFWDPKQNRSQWGLGLQTGIKRKSEHWWMRVWAHLHSLYPRLSHSGVCYPSCSQLDKRLKNSMNKPYSPRDICIWKYHNKMTSWTTLSSYIKLHVWIFQ